MSSIVRESAITCLMFPEIHMRQAWNIKVRQKKKNCKIIGNASFAVSITINAKD